MSSQDRSPHRAAEEDVGDGPAHRRMITSPAAEHRAREANETTRALEATANGPFDVRFAQVGGWLLVLAAVVVLVAQANLVGHTPSGRWSSARDTGLAILLGLGGLRLALATGRCPVAAGVALLAGAGLVLSGLLTEHASAGLAGIEVVFGVLAALCALGAWVSPTRSPGSPPPPL